MTAEIICVGTELLLGDIVNTNAQFLSRELAELGISVLHQHVIGDNPARLKELVLQAKSRSDLLVFSGGLGPTEDDLTKETVAEAFGDTLAFAVQNTAHVGKQDQIGPQRRRQRGCRLIGVDVHQLTVVCYANGADHRQKAVFQQHVNQLRRPRLRQPDVA